MKLTEKVSWLMGRLQRSLFPILEQCCVSPLSEQEKHLVKIFEIIEIEHHIPRSRQWTGRPAAERRAMENYMIHFAFEDDYIIGNKC